jgi:hypothetical protein
MFDEMQKDSEDGGSGGNEDFMGLMNKLVGGMTGKVGADGEAPEKAMEGLM